MFPYNLISALPIEHSLQEELLIWFWPGLLRACLIWIWMALNSDRWPPGIKEVCITIPQCYAHLEELQSYFKVSTSRFILNFTLVDYACNPLVYNIAFAPLHGIRWSSFDKLSKWRRWVIIEMLFADCINDQANYTLIFKIKLMQHVNNSSLYIDACVHRNSAYLEVIQPQLLQQLSTSHMYVNRWYYSLDGLVRRYRVLAPLVWGPLLLFPIIRTRCGGVVREL